MTSKKDRRAAIEHELAERNRRLEASLLQRAGSLEWGRASILNPALRRDIVRLGGVPRPCDAPTACGQVVGGVVWPGVEYRASAARFRALMADQGVDYTGFSDDEVGDDMPHRCIDFRFEPHAFWDGWEADFPGVDPTTTFPLGSDGHYFLFVAANPNDPGDPLVLSVDHEETHEPAYASDGATIGRFLATLERANP